MRFLLGLLVIAHGLIYSLFFVKNPKDPNWPFVFNKSWFYEKFNQTPAVGKVLTVVTIAAFILAGLSLMIVPSIEGLWKSSLVTAATLAIILQVIFWRKRLILGLLIDLVLLYGVLIAHWSFN